LRGKHPLWSRKAADLVDEIQRSELTRIDMVVLIGFG